MNDQYSLFLQKFERKKTTDDCYTPANIYEVVADWVAERYGVNKADFVRPFWPDSDYTQFDYSKGCVVVDNPPFSILSQIVRDYNDEGIRFFLFAPYLRLIHHACNVIAPANIIYENGAEVPTAFVTNLAPELALEACPDLCDRIKAADKVNREERKRRLPKYEMPAEVLTSARAGYLAIHGVALKVRREECQYIRTLDAMRKAGTSGIYGSALLLSERVAAERAAAELVAAENAVVERAAAERAAAERAAAERANAISWPLSELEKMAVKALGEKPKRGEAAKES